MPSTGVNTFEISVSGPYRVVVACEGTFSTSIVEHARTAADGALLTHPCSRPHPFVVRGQMQQPGEVFLGDFGFGASMSVWDFALPADSGTFDLVLLGGDLTTGLDRIAIRRDLEITGDIDLGSIDISRESVRALVPTTFTAPNVLSSESRSVSVDVQAGATFASIDNSVLRSESRWTARLVPDGVLRPTDHQTVTLGAYIDTDDGTVRKISSRSVSQDVRVGGSTSMRLPEPLGPVTFAMTADRLTATWSSLPDHDEVSLSRLSLRRGTVQLLVHELRASADFLEVIGATSVVLDLSDIPGLKSEWRHDPAAEPLRSLDVGHGTLNSGAFSEVSEVSESPSSDLPAGVREMRNSAYHALRRGPGGSLVRTSVTVDGDLTVTSSR